MYHGVCRHLGEGLARIEVLVVFSHGDVVGVGLVLLEDRMTEGVVVTVVGDIGNGYGIDGKIDVGHTYLLFAEDVLNCL